MLKKRSRLSRAGVISILTTGLLMIVAGSASAVSTNYFSELLTADQAFLIPSNVRVTLDTSTDHNLLDVMLDGTYQAGLGLGDGYLSGPGDSIVYVHRFTPAASVASIDKVWLSVGVLDDQFCDWREAAEILVDGSFWKSGQATMNLFSGDVTAYFADNDGDLTVSVVSRRGDFNVIGSLFSVDYTADTGAPNPGDIVAVPEPGAALLFCAGIFVVARGARRARMETAVG